MNFQKFEGKEYTEEIKMLMALEDGDLYLRVIKPNMGFTEDYLSWRTNIFLNENNVIIGITNG